MKKTSNVIASKCDGISHLSRGWLWLNLLHWFVRSCPEYGRTKQKPSCILCKHHRRIKAKAKDMSVWAHSDIMPKAKDMSIWASEIVIMCIASLFGTTDLQGKRYN